MNIDTLYEEIENETKNLVDKLESSKDSKKISLSTKILKKSKTPIFLIATTIALSSGLMYQKHQIEQNNMIAYSSDIQGQIDRYNNVGNRHYSERFPSISSENITNLTSGIYKNPFVDNNIVTLIIDNNFPSEVGTYEKAKAVVLNYASTDIGSYHRNEMRDIIGELTGKDSEYHYIHIDSEQVNRIKEKFPEKIQSLAEPYVLYHEISHAHPEQYDTAIYAGESLTYAFKKAETTSDINSILKLNKDFSLSKEDTNLLIDTIIKLRMENHLDEHHATVAGLKLFKEHFNKNSYMYDSLSNHEAYMMSHGISVFSLQQNYSSTVKRFIGEEGKSVYKSDLITVIEMIKEGEIDSKEKIKKETPMFKTFIEHEDYPFKNYSLEEINDLAEKIEEKIDKSHINSFNFMLAVKPYNIEKLTAFSMEKEEKSLQEFLIKNNWIPNNSLLKEQKTQFKI